MSPNAKSYLWYDMAMSCLLRTSPRPEGRGGLRSGYRDLHFSLLPLVYRIPNSVVFFLTEVSQKVRL